MIQPRRYRGGRARYLGISCPLSRHRGEPTESEAKQPCFWASRPRQTNPSVSGARAAPAACPPGTNGRSMGTPPSRFRFWTEAKVEQECPFPRDAVAVHRVLVSTRRTAADGSPLPQAEPPPAHSTSRPARALASSDHGTPGVPQDRFGDLSRSAGALRHTPADARLNIG